LAFATPVFERLSRDLCNGLEENPEENLEQNVSKPKVLKSIEARRKILRERETQEEFRECF